MRTLAIANQKGGCGKTTTAVNLSAAIAETGSRTLLIDLDPQGHSTIGFGYDPDHLDVTVYHILTSHATRIRDAAVETDFDTLDLLPSNILLAGAEVKLAPRRERETTLADKLAEVSDYYEYCVIDCPPSVGMLTLNAIVASNDIIVPVQLHYYAMEGLKQLFETTNIIREKFRCCRAEISGLLLTFVESNTLFGNQIQQQMRDYFGDLVLDTVIHRAIRLAEAPSAGESIMTYAPVSRASEEFRELASEICNV